MSDTLKKIVNGVLVDLTDTELQDYNSIDESEINNILSIENRNIRNSLLSASDWTQVQDAPVDTSAWATYRQALRDIPQQEGFPLNVIWPVEP